MLLSSLNTPVTQIIHASGKMKTYQITFGILTSMVIPTSWIALHFGMPAYSVFVICIIFTILTQLACLYVMNKVFPIDFISYANKTVAPLICTAILSPVAGYLITQVMEESFIRLVIVGLISLGISLMLSYMIVLNKEERKVVTAFIIKKIKK